MKIVNWLSWFSFFFLSKQPSHEVQAHLKLPTKQHAEMPWHTSSLTKLLQFLRGSTPILHILQILVCALTIFGSPLPCHMLPCLPAHPHISSPLLHAPPPHIKRIIEPVCQKHTHFINHLCYAIHYWLDHSCLLGCLLAIANLVRGIRGWWC